MYLFLFYFILFVSIFRLMSKRPEQEQKLLTILVEKLGDSGTNKHA